MQNNLIGIELKILDPRIASGEFPIPARATIGSAGFDLRAMVNTTLILSPGSTELIPSGIAISIRNPAMCMLIIPRSGLGHKNGGVLGNGTGLIDSDFQGEIFISLYNRGYNPIKIMPGDRIAQGFFVPVILPEFVVVSDFSTNTERGVGGFGHTGKH